MIGNLELKCESSLPPALLPDVTEVSAQEQWKPRRNEGTVSDKQPNIQTGVYTLIYWLSNTPWQMLVYGLSQLGSDSYIEILNGLFTSVETLYECSLSQFKLSILT
jgi:hypothetical protein